MKVFIIGGTGVIGLPAAQALVRAGHIVYALARNSEKAKQLQTEEIIPIVGDATDPSKWISIVEKIDVLIETVGGTPDLPKVSQGILDATVAAVKNRPVGAAKLAYIYTSGTWVHGDDRETIVSDNTPSNNPPDIVAWRPALEQNIINLSALNGIVVRPALIYGRSASILEAMFQSAHSGQVKWPGSPGGRFNLIHPDDLASFYVLVSEKATLVGGKIFDVGNDITESVDDVLQKLTKISGAKGYEYTTPVTLFDKAIATTVILRPYLARALLGWQPRKAGLVDHLEIYYDTWKAIKGYQ